METSALVTIENAVSDFLLGYKKSNDDYVVYLRNALVLLQDYMTYDSTEARSEKVAVSALGIIEMPTDLIRLKDVCVARNGEWWTMTERQDLVNTTTFTGLVEGQDSDFGEGVALKENTVEGYGATGARNDYYYAVDYKARRIFIDGLKSDTVLLRYVSSGISLTGTTYIPSLLVPVLDCYLLYKETFWNETTARDRDWRAKDLRDERAKVRNLLNSLSSSQWRDIFWGGFSQSPKR